MRTLTIWTLVLTMFMLSGCATSNVCPPFPKPSKEVIMELQGLGSKEVDSWVVELYKLQLKLESK
jgi:uncharacterized protein YcfL